MSELDQAGHGVEVDPQTVDVTFYIPPNGTRNVVTVPEVYPQDAKFINFHGVAVSMEELITGQKVVYFDYGIELDDGTPDEHIVVVQDGQSCKDALKQGVDFIRKETGWEY